MNFIIKNKKIIILFLSILLIISFVWFYYCTFYETDEKRKTKEFAESINDNLSELKKFNEKKDKELQDKLELIDKGYNVDTKSYFSSPENLKLQYYLKEKGYKFETITIKNENTTYFFNDNYTISCIININTNEFINIAFWDKSLKGEACSVLNLEKNNSEEKQKQYSSYLGWISDNIITEEQIKSVLFDYYLDNR